MGKKGGSQDIDVIWSPNQIASLKEKNVTVKLGCQTQRVSVLHDICHSQQRSEEPLGPYLLLVTVGVLYCLVLFVTWLVEPTVSAALRAFSH